MEPLATARELGGPWAGMGFPGTAEAELRVGVPRPPPRSGLLRQRSSLHLWGKVWEEGVSGERSWEEGEPRSRPHLEGARVVALCLQGDSVKWPELVSTRLRRVENGSSSTKTTGEAVEIRSE